MLSVLSKVWIWMNQMGDQFIRAKCMFTSLISFLLFLFRFVSGCCYQIVAVFIDVFMKVHVQLKSNILILKSLTGVFIIVYVVMFTSLIKLERNRKISVSLILMFQFAHSFLPLPISLPDLFSLIPTYSIFFQSP